jgi:hypothetical protein
MMERLRFSMAKSAATQEARDTCEAAAAPVSDDAGLRQTSTDRGFGTAEAVNGEWQIIRDSNGKCN